MRWPVLALCLSAACDVRGRNIDVTKYACTADADCGTGATCMNQLCELTDAGGGTAGGGEHPPCDLRTDPVCDTGGGCLLQAVGGTGVQACYGPCDPVRQNCSGGQRCGVATSTGTGCRPAGHLAENAVCDPAADDCNAGLACVDDGTGSKTCQKFCDFRPDSCPSGKQCSATVFAPGQPVALACRRAECSLLTQNCTAGRACLALIGGSTACSNSGGHGLGATCTNIADCRPGTTCVAVAGGGGKCFAFCNGDGGAPACTQPDTCDTGVMGPLDFPFFGGAGVCD